jgi:zinc transporter ZupT
MKPTTIIYWTRTCLGVIAALINTLLKSVADINISFLNGLTIALLVYIATHYVFKALFLTKVEKPSKIFTTGIGAYFLTWIVAWIVFYTLLNPQS